MTRTSLDILTHSSALCLRECPRKYFYRYELGVVPAVAAKYFRIGDAIHLGRALWASGLPIEQAVGEALARFGEAPAGANVYRWNVDRQVVQQMLTGYAWRYGADEWAVLAVESTFDFRLRNPETGRAIATTHRGKIDGIIGLVDRRQAVYELKTTGESIADDSKYWLRLRGDPQISIYMLAAREMGFSPSVVIYDVIRKPEIEPKQIPILDEAGIKVVLDRSGARVHNKDGTWKQAGSAAEGWELQTRPETPEEYGARLLKDIGDRPEFYFARREVPRTEADLEEQRWELFFNAQHLREMRRHKRWFRNVSQRTCDGCDYQGPCLQGVEITRESPPSGFVAIDDVHPELSS